jgi:hypothetical protein
VRLRVGVVAQEARPVDQTRIWISSFASDTSWVGSGLVAGARNTAPEVTSNCEPWHWHMSVVPVSSPDESGHASCGQRSSKA